VFLTILLVVLFVGICIFRSRSGIIFPIIFGIGAFDNALMAARAFMNNQKRAGFVLTGAVIALALMLAFSLQFISVR
jgi:hypothetical protein